MSKQIPLISIIIPTYKGAKYLPTAIDSCLKQTYPNIEIIVVDDNNPDTPERAETEIAVKPFVSYPNFMYIQHEKNKNGSAARNSGALISHGEYLAFLDDDDLILPDKIYNQIKRLQSLSPEYVACYSKFVVKKDGKITQYSGEKREGRLGIEALMRNLFIAGGSNLLVRKTAFNNINGFDESFQRNQDIEFIVRLLKQASIAFDNNLGLIINAPSKPKNLNFVEITNNYLHRFEQEINSLNKTQKKRFNQLISLQLLRYFLLSKKDVKSTFSLVKEKQLSIVLISKYFIHLLIRRIKKQRYGFKF